MSSSIILVPVDFSSTSKAALRHAALLAPRLDATLEIVHVIHDPAEAPGYYASITKKKAPERLEVAAQEMMEDFLRKASKEKAARPAIEAANIRMVLGIPVTRILELEEELEPMMIVVGSHGRTGLKRLLMGSKAEQVVRLCRAPVMVVKD